MKIRLILLGMLMVTLSSWGADNLITPGTTAMPINGRFMYLQTADDHIVPAIAVFSTDGAGHLTPIPGGGGSGTIGAVNQGNKATLANEWYVQDATARLTLSQIFGQLDVALSTRASEATLSLFSTTNHTDLQAILSAVTLGTTGLATESTLSILNGKVVHVDTGNVTVVASALPSGAATAAKQDVGNASVSSIDAKLGTLGQKPSTGSAPVVVASDQSPLPVAQSGFWDIRDITGAVSLPTGASTSANQTTEISSLATLNSSIQAHEPRDLYDGSANAITSQASGSQRPLDVGVNVAGVQVDPRTRTWNLSSASDSIGAVQSGFWDVRNVTGTVSLPTGAATATLQNTGNTSLSSINTSLDTTLSTRAADTTLQSTNTKLDTVNSNLVTVEGKQDTGNASLSSLDTKFNVNLSTRASEATLSSFQSANHTDLLGVQTRQDTTNTSVGDTSETVAATDTATSGLNGLLKRLLQRVTTLLSYYAADYGVSTGAIRTASQIGNATGAANFNAGATGAQTLRTAANLHDSLGNAVTTRSYDSVRPVDVYMTQVGASSVNDTTVTPTANVSTQLLAANPARKWVKIINSSGASFSIRFGSAAVVGSGMTVANNTTYDMTNNMLYLGAINGIVASNGRTIEIMEGF